MKNFAQNGNFLPRPMAVARGAVFLPGKAVGIKQKIGDTQTY
jgi:hypothetical protein